MIVIDNTWDKIDEDNYYRQSPVQPRPDKFIYYQFVRLSNARIIEVEFPTKDNRKELERIALGCKWITRKNKLDEYLQNNPDCMTEWLSNQANATMKLYSNFPIYLRHPDGHMCYERLMLTTDPGYRKGMDVIADIDNETIYMKHFDNVSSNAMNKGFTIIKEEEALRPTIRNKRLEEILK